VGKSTEEHIPETSQAFERTSGCLDDVHIILILYCLGGEIGGGTHPRDPLASQTFEGQ